MTTQGLEAATEKMRSAGVPGVAIDVFSRFHEQVRSQVTGLIPEDSISPLEQVTRLDDVVAGSAGAIDDVAIREALGRTVIIKLNGKHADALAQAANDGMKELKDRVITITFDNGLEFAAHEKMAAALEADIFFANPYCSWERGANENINGLIRQYFPKGTDFSTVTEESIQAVMTRLNNRPRATRKFKTPNELFMGQRVDLLAA